MTKFGKIKAQPPSHAPQKPPRRWRYQCRPGSQSGPGETDDRDGLARLVFREPATLIDQLALHLPDERDRPAKAEQTKAQKISPSSPRGSFFDDRVRRPSSPIS